VGAHIYLGFDQIQVKRFFAGIALKRLQGCRGFYANDKTFVSDQLAQMGAEVICGFLAKAIERLFHIMLLCFYYPYTFYLSFFVGICPLSGVSAFG
jgi:hypothetical protein